MGTAVLLAAQSLSAQLPSTTSPFLPPDHWAYSVLRRLDAAGLLPPGSDLARRSIPQEEVAALLTFAAGSDTTSAAEGYLLKFREEHGAARAQSAAWAYASARGGYRVADNRVLAGVGYDTVWSGARAVDDEHEGEALLRGGFASRYVAGALGVDVDGVDELQAVIAASAIAIWAGRREIGFATGFGGGLVLDALRIDGGGLFFTRPINLLFVKRFRFETHLSKIENRLGLNGIERAAEPWFWSARASFEPHRRLRIGLNRGMMFGGEGNLPVTFSRVFNNLIGNFAADGENSFANQLFSVDLRYRFPIGSQTVTTYLDWGVDDAAGGWWEVPGITGGVELSLLPSRDLSLGLERTEFVRNLTSNSLWYQNSWFRGSWADAGVALGHPLGGHGIEWRVLATGGRPARGMNGDLSLYRRRRGSQNIYAPERAGHSVGGTMDVTARLSETVRLLAAGEIESGDSWTAFRASGSVRIVF